MSAWDPPRRKHHDTLRDATVRAPACHRGRVAWHSSDRFGAAWRSSRESHRPGSERTGLLGTIRTGSVAQSGRANRARCAPPFFSRIEFGGAGRCGMLARFGQVGWHSPGARIGAGARYWSARSGDASRSSSDLEVDLGFVDTPRAHTHPTHGKGNRFRSSSSSSCGHASPSDVVVHICFKGSLARVSSERFP